MAQDFRRGAAKITPRHSKRPRSCVWWFLFGCVLGGVGVALYWITQAPERMPPPVAELPKAERPAAPEPKFQFEKILRETVVDTSDPGKPPPPPAAKPEPPKPEPDAGKVKPTEGGPKPRPEAGATKTEPATGGGRFVLQVGSFRTAKDADALKAKLAMQGISTRVQTVTLANGQVWHRVMTGPVNGKKAVDDIQTTLRKHGTEAVPIQVK